MTTKTDDEILVRKYRKKLRQIEKLELLERDLTEEEELKVVPVEVRVLFQRFGLIVH